MLPGPAVPGCSLVSFHFLWAILCPQAMEGTSSFAPFGFRDFAHRLYLYVPPFLPYRFIARRGRGPYSLPNRWYLAPRQCATVSAPDSAISVQPNYVGFN